MNIKEEVKITENKDEKDMLLVGKKDKLQHFFDSFDPKIKKQDKREIIKKMQKDKQIIDN